MLLERRATPRYATNDPAPITIDSVVEGAVVNASEAGLAVATPYKPILNSVVRISVQLPNNDCPYETRAQVVRAASSGQIGLRLIKPEDFSTHFDMWRRFSTHKVSYSDAAAQLEADTALLPVESTLPQADAAADSMAQPSLDLEELRAAILQDPEPPNLPVLNRLVLGGGVLLCVLFGAAIWLWYGHTHKGDANVQAASSTPPAESVPVLTPARQDATQAPSETAVPPLMANSATVTTTSDRRLDANATKSALASTSAADQPPSHAQIVVKLNRFTQVNPKLLHNPDRIYFDLSPGTRPELSKSSLLTGNRLVRRVRVGHAEDGRTRLVLDLVRPCVYHATISSKPPYKLVIKVSAESRRRRS